MYDSSLDPFGDGSLTQSWTFNTSGESVQGGNTFSNFGIGEGLFDDGMIDRPTDTDQITSLGHGVDGDVNLSFVYWFKAGYKSSSVSKDWHNFFFGGNGQRYNVWVRVAGTAVSTTRTYLSGGIHKNGESSVKSVSNLDN
ncbi:MAG: hypothetical protein U9O94_10185, partial [Nanoarchaeota archaeon]|nr:hypothetical protein [Nanoarchaeota archaeon]